MKLFSLLIGVPLVLALSAGPGDARLAEKKPAPKPLMRQEQALQRQLRSRLPRLYPLPPSAPGRGLGDVFPDTYMIFGLKTGSGGMYCTDRNGAALTLPSFQPRLQTGPVYGLPRFSSPPLPPQESLPKKHRQ